jgi:DNA-binding beta-propeller fold protein YncE
MKLRTRVIAAVAGFNAAVAVLAASGYHQTNTVALSGPTNWDYVSVDANARKVYITNSTQVQVLDADKLSVAGTIAGISGPHGVAIAAGTNKGFVTAAKRTKWRSLIPPR